MKIQKKNCLLASDSGLLSMYIHSSNSYLEISGPSILPSADVRTMDIERRLDIFCVIENVTFPVGNL